MTAWAGASGLDRTAFAARFMAPGTSDATIDAWRSAAEGGAARTSAALRAAGAALAGAMRRVGLDRWSGFLRDAAERATNAPWTGGRYVADNPMGLISPKPVGDGECVALVQRAAGMPLTRYWRREASVRGNPDIKPGTIIATFDDDGRYGNHTDGTSHAAIYLRQDEKGIYVIEQYNRRNNGVVVENVPPHVQFIPWDVPGNNKINQGKNYYVVQ